MQQERARQQRRADRLARLAAPGGGNWLWRLMRRGWVQAGYAVADHTRSALILSVFAFKVSAVRDVRGGCWVGALGLLAAAASAAARMLFTALQLTHLGCGPHSAACPACRAAARVVVRLSGAEAGRAESAAPTTAAATAAASRWGCGAASRPCAVPAVPPPPH